ncbi:Na+/H+ antiporter NhaC [Leptospira perolatii]|uniref:Na+/H+ antiporter NhaC n=1 Tax=Leptospira perolatii TaxID=2023191 RepID=A0A2M9ZL87_9LEPT|nr:Na+/H+ antiporter NhaC [Leptospira perolatii]PJZ70317.1 Na+/H+ antiporter NhaC [Leptospira perolatii]PJZ72799.1 Na+/H+ antiporter NhaC [Leptospira perolatii]
MKNSTPSLFVSVLPLLFLVISLSFAGFVFGKGITDGPAQILLFTAGTISAGISKIRGIPWEEIENSIVESMRNIISPILILLLIGALIGIWIRSGIVPALIVWGLELMRPEVFLPSVLILTSVVSLATGSSWSTAGTVGVALVGVGAGMGIPLGIVAGAIVSGSYFGDKLSPFSETTNLASSITEVPLLSHIRNMAITTLPAFLISLVLFIILGFGQRTVDGSGTIQPVISSLRTSFQIGWYLLIPPFLTFFLIYLRVPAIPALIFGIVSGSALAVITQDGIYKSDLSFWENSQEAFRSVLISASMGTKVKTGQEILDNLLSRGGMSSMLPTVWLIISAMFYAGTMEGGGMTRKFADSILRIAKSRRSILTSTVMTGLGVNLLCADQYLAIVVPAKMYKEAYSRKEIDPRNLSRALEDSGTMTSALVPWNSCGSFMALALGVPTVAYLPYAFLNLLSPVLSLFTAWTGIGIAGKKK